MKELNRVEQAWGLPCPWTPGSVAPFSLCGAGSPFELLEQCSPYMSPLKEMYILLPWLPPSAWAGLRGVPAQEERPIIKIRIQPGWGTWVAQSVKHLTLDLGSDFTVCETEPRVGLCADREEPAWDSLSPSLSLSLPCSHSLSLSLSLF